MSVDLTNVFNESRQLINIWKSRYSVNEFPQKVIMNIFYRKYTIEKTWSTISDETYSNWETAYQNNQMKYFEISIFEIVPIPESKLKSNDQVTSIKYSDFEPYIQSAALGNEEAIKGIEYTYFLHRILDQLGVKKHLQSLFLEEMKR